MSEPRTILGPSGRPILSLKNTAASVAPAPAPVCDLPPSSEDAPSWRQIKKQVQEELAWLRETWPAAFAEVKPLAVGVGRTIEALAVEQGRNIKSLRRALSTYFRHREYLEAIMAPDSTRHSLDGDPCEPVTDEHRAAAKTILEKKTIKFNNRQEDKQLKEAPRKKLVEAGNVGKA